MRALFNVQQVQRCLDKIHAFFYNQINVHITKQTAHKIQHVKLVLSRTVDLRTPVFCACAT